jgi:GntR family transcriptional regulator, rspAB operon transcriptional repressor
MLEAPVVDSQVKPRAALMRDDVLARIRADILACVLAPGSKIYEQVLAEQYGVSKSPVRDALMRLAQQGLVEVLPRKGYRVLPVSVSDAREMYEMRLMLERECVNRTIDAADDQTLARLDQFRVFNAKRGLAAWIEYNRAFHLAIAQACGNRRLERMTRDIVEHFDRLTYLGVAPLEARALGGFVDEHASIIDAIQRRDKREAQALTREHVDSSRKRMLDALARLPVIP